MSSTQRAPNSPPVSRRKPATPSASKIKSSVQALPTPPQTKTCRKRKRGRVASPVGRLPSINEELQGHKGEGEEDSKVADVVVVHKKRRISKLDALAEQLAQQAEEDAFWGVGPTQDSPHASPKSGSEKASARSRSLSRSPTRSPSSSPVRLLRRTRSGLLSPPPSRRQPVPVALPITPQRPKRTPKAEVKKKLFPERDSPNNPFLLSDEDEPKSTVSSPRSGSLTPLRHVEKPTITYVFRGVKGVFENPLYDPSHPDGVQPSTPGSPSRRPVSDPEFSPTPYCPPKLLFPDARRNDHARRRRAASDGDGSPHAKLSRPVTRKLTRKRSFKKSEWDSSDEEDDRVLEKAANMDAVERMGGVALDEQVSKVISKTDSQKQPTHPRGRPDANISRTSRKK